MKIHHYRHRGRHRQRQDHPDRKLRDHFGANEVSVLNHDSYYKRHDELPL